MSEDQSLAERPKVGAVLDGGASWRQRLLKRAAETAQAEGRALDEVVEQRFGVSNVGSAIQPSSLRLM